MIGREPSAYELDEDFRRLEKAVEKGFDDVRSELKTLDQIFLRKELYSAEHRARDAELRAVNRILDEMNTRLLAQIADLRKATSERADTTDARLTNNWRLALTGLIFPTVMILVLWFLSKALGT